MSEQRPAASDLDPVDFAVAFTRAMRRQRTAMYVPSLRTSLAIPKWLTARALRESASDEALSVRQRLVPADYVRAAVLCTPLEDQRLAESVARALVFPEVDGDAPQVEVADDEGGDPAAPQGDAMADLLGDLASLDVDLDALSDLSDLDALLDDSDDTAALGAFDVFEQLYSSADPGERALGELVHRFGGPAELESAGARSVSVIRIWVARQLLASVGELTPEILAHGVVAGFGPDLRRTCQEPWEVAGVLAGEGDPGLHALLEDQLDPANGVGASARARGRTLAFLAPHPGMAEPRQAFATAALGQARELADFAELVVGLGEWIDPPDGLIDASVGVNPRRTLEAAKWLESSFGFDLRAVVFDAWFGRHPDADLEALALMAVPCTSWGNALQAALPAELQRLAAPTSSAAPAPGAVPPALNRALHVADVLQQTALDPAPALARQLATAAMVRVSRAALFLPVLDAFLERHVVPDVDPVLARARELGVSEEEVLDRLGKALEQLRQMVWTDSHDADRYQRLVERIRQMPREMMEQLAAQAVSTGNLEALAALLAIDMGAAAEFVAEEQAANAIGYKGIGGGANLLVQWFTHRANLKPSFKARIKEQAKAALLGQALDWMGKGDGSGERGLVPQHRTRPFRAGDGLDALDLESTLDGIVASGKSPDQVTEEDLFASDTARGRAALAVLVDISGSMGGGELAVCAIAVVMLLGKLLAEEVALAVFESNTHVIKPFADVADLDQVADQVLELQATGGTRADAALEWAADQFAGAPEADVRVLYLLSDFAFFEGEQALRSRSQALAEQGARLLAASHGYIDRQVLTLMLETLGGEHLEIKNLNRLPELLLASLTRLGDTG